MHQPKNNITIVLINTSHPGNIGSVARAMKTMNLSNLVLVSPKRFPAPEAIAMAAGADDVLENAKIVDTLDEAVADCQLLFGTSARDRSLPWAMQTPKQAALKINEQSPQTKIALVFGREDKGLKNEELQRCHFHIQIPANPEYSSLNLAQAVQVVAYEIYAQNTADFKSEVGYDSELADNHSMELFYQHLEQMLLSVKFLNPQTPNRIMPRLRRLFSRAQPDMTELAILRGMLTEIERKTNNK